MSDRVVSGQISYRTAMYTGEGWACRCVGWAARRREAAKARRGRRVRLQNGSAVQQNKTKSTTGCNRLYAGERVAVRDSKLR